MMKTTTFAVSGMSCEHCVHAISEALNPLPGVESVHVDLPNERVEVTHDGQTAQAVMASAIADAGYGVDTREKQDGLAPQL